MWILILIFQFADIIDGIYLVFHIPSEQICRARILMLYYRIWLKNWIVCFKKHRFWQSSNRFILAISYGRFSQLLFLNVLGLLLESYVHSTIHRVIFRSSFVRYFLLMVTTRKIYAFRLFFLLFLFRFHCSHFVEFQ